MAKTKYPDEKGQEENSWSALWDKYSDEGEVQKEQIGLKPTEESVKAGLERRDQIKSGAKSLAESIKEAGYPGVAKAGEKTVDALADLLYPKTVKEAEEQTMNSLMPVAGRLGQAGKAVSKEGLKKAMAYISETGMTHNQFLDQLPNLYKKFGREVMDDMVARLKQHGKQVYDVVKKKL